MPKTSARLLAVCAAGAALLTTAVPATAATAPEATVAAYVLTDNTAATEALIAENADLTAPFLASGHTEAHRAWDIRLSDEAYAPPALPTQPFVATASHTDTNASARVGGFVSLTDRHPRDLPFVVLKLGSRNVSCTVDGPVFTGGGGSPELWVRHETQLVKLNDIGHTQIISVMPAHFPGSIRVPTSVRATPISSASQIAAYPQFAKYDGRANAGVIGYEIQIVQRGEEPYTVLVAAAASC